VSRRRTPGEGTLRRRSNGLWEYRVTVGYDSKGRQRQHSFYGSTAAEARERARLAPAIADSERITVAAYLGRWLKYREHPPGGEPLKPLTVHSYRLLIRVHVTPRIGGLQLRRLRPLHVEELLAELAAGGLAERSVRNVRNVLSSALRQAVAWGLIPDSPVKPTPRRRQARERKPQATWSSAEVLAFLEAAHGHRLYALFYLAITTGAREAELVALHLEDLDLAAGTLWIRRSLAYVPKQGLIEGTPKTARSRRQLHLPPDAVQVLTEHLERLEAERAAARELWTEHGLLFPSTVGTHLSPRNLIRAFQNLQRKTAVSTLTFHGLRHTYASLALRRGLPLRELADRLGHYDPSFTFSVYTHVLPDAPPAGLSIAELTAGADDQAENQEGVN
jgi:integrase